MNAHPGVPTARLPGVRNWLRGLAEDLRAGRSCVCLLPRVYASGQECFAEELLMELLPQLDDYILLPSGRKVEASERPASEPPPALTAHWSGLPPLLDYDDGLSGFGLTPSLAPTPTPNAGRLPSPAEALKELSNRLAGELGEPSSTIEHRWRAEGVAPSGCTDEVLARLVGRTDGRIEWRPIVIRVWREEAASASTGFLRRLVATAKEAGLAPTHRPCVLLVAAADDLPTDLPDQLSREDVAVHWWWGAIGRLDTATVVTTSRPPSGGLSEGGKCAFARV